MNKDTTAMFIGHRECWGLDEEKVRKAIVGLIADGYREFLCGGMGNFDMTCARLMKQLKREYPEVRCYLLIPYLSFNINGADCFDEIIYPDGFEKYHFKAAIVKRNEYMVENSTAAVCYVVHGWGGAAKTYSRALKKGHKIINTAE